LNYSGKIFKDSYFDNELATLTEVEQNLDENLDFQLNSTVQFVHNFADKEYDTMIAEDSPQIGLNLPGGETKLVNLYESILNNLIQPVVIKLRQGIDCFRKNLIVFLRPKNYLYDSKVIYTLSETLPLINKFYPFEMSLPYRTEINFQLQPTGPIGDAIEQTRNDGLLMRHLQENEGLVSRSTTTSLSGNKAFKQTVATRKKKRKTVSYSYLVEEKNELVTWTFYEWILKLSERLKNIRDQKPGMPTSVEKIPTDSIILNNSTKTAQATAGFNTPLINYSVSLSALYSKVAQIMKSNSRSYPELLAGFKPHKEVIAYKIEKYANVSSQRTSAEFTPINTNEILDSSIHESLHGPNGILRGNPAPVQEFWFFNSSREEIVNYVDTQLKNDTFYTYVVYAYVMVLESEYYYTNVSNLGQAGVRAKSLDFEPPTVATTDFTPTDPTQQAPDLRPTITGVGIPSGGDRFPERQVGPAEIQDTVTPFNFFPTPPRRI
jgi:hypothetical protein